MIRMQTNLEECKRLNKCRADGIPHSSPLHYRQLCGPSFIISKDGANRLKSKRCFSATTIFKPVILYQALFYNYNQMPSNDCCEISESFTSFAEFKEWCNLHPEIYSQDMLDIALENIRKSGIQNIVTGERISPDHLTITPNLRESLLYQGLNCRIRAVLLELISTQAAMALHENQIRIYAPEALTSFALLLRGRYPFFIGSEYLPSCLEQEQYFPIMHQDIQAMAFPNDAFHIAISNEVFEHLPFPDKALVELHRILKSDGVLICTFPFAFNSEHSIVKAKQSDSGEIVFLMEPEYHGNPVDPEKGILVFEIPGWDILQRTRDAGFRFVEIRLRVSTLYGVLAEGINGVLTMIARK